MSGLLPRGSWRPIKPALGTALDRGHPLSHALVGAWLFNEGGGGLVVNSAGPLQLPTRQTVAWAPQSDGQVLNIAATSAFQGSSSRLAIAPPFTIVIKVRSRAFGGNFNIVAMSSSGGAPYHGIALSTSSTMYFFTSAGNANGATVVSGDRPQSVVAVAESATSRKIYLDGKLDGTSTASYSGGTNDMALGSWTSGSEPFNGWLHCLLIYHRALTPSEVAAVSADPYQMFVPPVWRRFFIPPSGGTGVTGTGAIAIGAPQLAGTGSFATTGSGAPSIAKPVLAATGSFATTGAGAASIASPVLAATGSFATTGSGAIAIGPPVLAGAGSFTTTGTGAISIGIPVLAGTGTVTGPPGSGDISIAPPVIAGTGSFATTGSGAIAILPPVIAATGSFATTGSGAISIGGPAVAGSGSAVDPGTGSGAISIVAPVLAASGTFTTTGSGALSIAAPVVVGTGTLIYTGTGTITIPGPLLSGYSVLATRAAASDSAYGGAVGSDAAYTGAGAGDLALAGATASDSEV